MIFFSAIFIILSIIIGILDVKKRKLIGREKLKTIFYYLYFGISMGAFFFFMTVNALLSIIIFLHLLFIVIIFDIKSNGASAINIDLLIICIIGISLSMMGTLKIKINNLWYAFLILGIYLLPMLGYISRRNKIIKKMKRCTQEVDAKIIKIYKGSLENGHRGRVIYVPKFEFMLNEKKYNCMNSSEIYFENKSEHKVGDTVKLFIDSNIENHLNSIYDDYIFLPNMQREEIFRRNVIFFYIVTILMIGLVLFWNIIS